MLVIHEHFLRRLPSCVAPGCEHVAMFFDGGGFGLCIDHRPRVAMWSKEIERRATHQKVNRIIRTLRSGNAGGSHTKEEWDGLQRAYGFLCVACLNDDVELTRDHVVAVSNGGSGNIDNIQPLCRSCNSRKGNSNTDYRPTFAARLAERKATNR